MRPLLPALLLVCLLAPPGPAFPAGDAVEEAESHLAAGRPAEARVRLETRLSAEGIEAPERARLLEALGRCLRAEDRPWDAEAAFGSALEARGDFYEAAVGRGEVFLDLALGADRGPGPTGAGVRALATDARRWLEKALGLRPGDARSLRALVRARVLDGDFRAAAEAARAILAADPADGGAHHLLAEALRGAGDREGSVRAARDALIRDPGADDVYRILWESAASSKRFEAMEEALLGVLAKHPDHPRALYYLGYCQFQAGRRDAALESFRRKAALEPANPQPRVAIGRLLVGKGDLSAAEKILGEALAVLPADSPDRQSALDALASIGGRHGAARAYADAERVFGSLVEREPGNPDYRMNHALSLRRLGRREEAEKEYLEAIEQAPYDGGPRNDLGLLYLGWGRVEDARRTFEESAREDPRVTASLENLGNMARAAGRTAEALARFREAYRRASLHRDEEERLKFRRYLDAVAREP